MKLEEGYELIITIVNKGWSERVIKAGRHAGAQGATVLHARGSGLYDTFTNFLGIAIEPEKELVLNVVPTNTSDAVVGAISDALDLEKHGHGISMVIPIRGVTGLFKPSDKQ
jgi:nitrogen regulatory protein PII